jgi:hypothetical protein
MTLRTVITWSSNLAFTAGSVPGRRIVPERRMVGDRGAVIRLLDVVGTNLALKAQYLQDELANPTRLLALLGLQGFTWPFVTCTGKFSPGTTAHCNHRTARLPLHTG